MKIWRRLRRAPERGDLERVQVLQHVRPTGDQRAPWIGTRHRLVVDIVSALGKVSTKPDQAQTLKQKVCSRRQGQPEGSDHSEDVAIAPQSGISRTAAPAGNVCHRQGPLKRVPQLDSEPGLRKGTDRLGVAKSGLRS
jgi:hypothetical protein